MPVVSKGDDKFCKLSIPHSNAFVDLDGDCLADLFLTCADGSNPARVTSFQIWTNKKSAGFQLSARLEAPSGVGAISFTDVDGDGTMDMVYTVCDPQPACELEHSLNVVYNQQAPLCSWSIRDNCRPVDHLCNADDSFSFDLRPTSNGLWALNLSAVLRPRERVLQAHLAVGESVPLPVRTGMFSNTPAF